MPTIAPAPARFSTMNCWPRRLVRSAARMRVTMSVLPPGAHGMTMRTGRSGHAALALMVVNATAAATRTATANLPFATAFMEPPFYPVLRWRAVDSGDRFQSAYTLLLFARIRPDKTCCVITIWFYCFYSLITGFPGGIRPAARDVLPSTPLPPRKPHQLDTRLPHCRARRRFVCPAANLPG